MIYSALFAAAGAAAAAAYGTLLWEYFVRLWDRSHYQHFPFVLAAFGLLAWARIKERAPLEFPTRARVYWAAWALMAASWALLYRAYGYHSPWLAYLSLIILVAALVVLLCARWRIPGLWGVWTLLLLILPLPLGRDEQLITTLQRLSSRLSSLTLDTLGVQHLMEGNTLVLPEKKFFVDEACSGIISVMSVVACALIYAVWKRRPPHHAVLLILCGVGWATVMNTLRISAIALAYSHWRIDWSKGATHEVLSLCVFLLTFLAMLSSDVLLFGGLAPIQSTWQTMHGAGVRFGALFVRLWDRLQAPRVAAPTLENGPARPARVARLPRMHAIVLPITALAAFAFIPGWQLLYGIGRQAPNAEASAVAQACIDRALACDETLIPSTIGELRLARFERQERDRDDLQGQYSRSFEYRDQAGTAYLVSCDFPYLGGWHELTVCYLGIGWQLDARNLHVDSFGAPAQPWERMEADFSRPAGARGLLTACAFDEYGQPLPLPTWSLGDDAWQALTTRRDVQTSQVAFQVQVWTTSDGEIGAGERQVARELLIAARERFRDEVAEAPAEGSSP